MKAKEGMPLDGLARKLGRLAKLGEEDLRAIAALPHSVEDVPASRCLVREGQEPDRCCLLVAGYAFRHKLTQEGARQIVSIHLPGDILDLQHLFLSKADHNVQAMTRARVAWIPSAELKRVARERPRIGEALWRDALVDASIFREWVLNVGRRDAKTRIAHMLCEFAARGEAAGLGSAARFELPMTQEQIADATGLTPVHVNRMLRALSEDGVIARGNGEVRIADWSRMRAVADFDPAYLHSAAA
jgi:CRP-like cAMP-binding protein